MAKRRFAMINPFTKSDIVAINHSFFRNALGPHIPSRMDLVIELQRLIKKHATKSILQKDFPNFFYMIGDMFTYATDDIVEILLDSQDLNQNYRKICDMLTDCLDRTGIDADWGTDYTIYDRDLCANVLAKIALDIITFYIVPLKTIFGPSERYDVIENVYDVIGDTMTALTFLMRMQV
jgi:hypothetical protein